MSDPPQHRPFALELALGMAVAGLAAWLVFRSGGRGPRPSVSGAPALDLSRTQDLAALAEVELEEPDHARDAGERLEEEPAAAPEKEEQHPSHAEAEVPAARERGPDEELLRVLVLDASGLPAPAVPVRLSLETDPPSSGPVDPLRSTGEDGLVSFPLGALPEPGELGPSLGRAFDGRTFRRRVAVALPLQDAPFLDLDPYLPPPPLVTLRLPPAGRLLVHVVQEDGTPANGGVSVQLRVPSDGGGLRSLGSTSVIEGSAAFPWIDLDLELHLRAAFNSWNPHDAETVLAGPTYAGEQVEATLELGPEWPRVVLRAVDEGGNPLARTELRFLVTQEPLSPQRARCWTDPEGRGELQILGRHRPEHPRVLEIETGGEAARRGRVDLTFELEAGRPTDLGDVVLVRVGPR